LAPGGILSADAAPTESRRDLALDPFPLPRAHTSLHAPLSPTHAARRADPTVVEIKAIAGLRYDVPRFQVAPGAAVHVVFSNADDMAHNLVFTAPGARMEIVNAAITMPITPEQTFIPASDKILWHVPVLTPGQSKTLDFTAPATEGVYPYVCTYPGHGMIMFGAMYVSTREMPPLAKDQNVPEIVRDALRNAPLHAYTPEPPYLYRTFLRDCGPAAIAVALPGGQNFAWDAGACRLRYAWSGGFVDPRAHWGGNGDAFAEVKGRIYYRAGAEFPLRIGTRDKIPQVKFHGYRLVERYPEFHYEIDGIHVHELIKPLHHGGLQQTFQVLEVKAPVFFVSDPEAGAKLTSSVGEFRNGVLELTPQQTRSFTVTYTEIPGREPIGYWSMDDVLTEKKPLPVAGVKNRALVFDGKKAQFATGLLTDELQAGATFAVWAKLAKPELTDQAIIGGKGFAVGSNVGGVGFGVVCGDAKIASGEPADQEWHHLAVTFSKDGATLYVDGQPRGHAPAKLPEKATLFLGSQGGAHFAAATLDEARIYKLALSDTEIRALIARDRAPTATPPAL
jgi:azurin